MTGCEVERDERTARRSPAITRGGSPLMPSHSQGAERRPERRAGRTAAGWVLRALVIGGLAGMAWLLTGSAAHAAEPGGKQPGPVPRHAETGYEPTVGELLEAAAQPPESATGINQRHVVTKARAGFTPARKAKAQPRSQVHRHIPAARPAPETVHDDVPGDDGPVAWRMSLGAVSGNPVGGPGASPETGRWANGAVDDHRLPLAAVVEARRNDAEAPTVSPD